MKHRIRAAGLMLDSDQRILLVREVDRLTGSEFWVPPGGGMEPVDNSATECLARELYEETGLTATTVGRLVYLREFVESEQQLHHVELLDFQGEINPTHSLETASATDLARHAQWFHQEELAPLVIYPPELKQEFWQNLATKVTCCKYLGAQVK